MHRSWVVVGVGRCGLQLARSMRAAGVHIVAAVARSARSRALVDRLLPGVRLLPESEVPPPADVLLIAVPDSSVSDVAEAIAARPERPPPVALHTSGILPAAALAALGRRGTNVASFHPLNSFPAADGALVPLAGTLAAIEGEIRALGVARELAAALQMTAHHLRAQDKARYHAAAAVAANLTHALVRLACEDLEALSFTPAEARLALAPLVRGAIEAALKAEGWEYLTGAVARGDDATVVAHLAALHPEIASIYRQTAIAATSRLMTSKKLDRAAARRVLSALTAHS